MSLVPQNSPNKPMWPPLRMAVAEPDSTMIGCLEVSLQLEMAH